MSEVADFKPGLEGVVAVETEIAEPDREGGALRYRGVDIEELVGRVPYEKVWGLLVDESLEPGMPNAVVATTTWVAPLTKSSWTRDRSFASSPAW